jgi:hypothetical protein
MGMKAGGRISHAPSSIQALDILPLGADNLLRLC